MAAGSVHELTDEQLVLCANGNTRCVEALLERYEDKIRACAWRMVGDPNEIDDLTQETVLRLLRSLPSFRGEASVSTWIYRVAHNTCVDAHRRRSVRPEPAAQEAGEGAEAAAPGGLAELDPAALLEDAVAECFVEHALAELPEDYTAVATLRLLDGLPNEEIAERVGSTVDGVKSKVKRARARLRERLEEPSACPLCPPGEFRFDSRGLS
jgi:RNA polymerase sigma-70 factor (ECF subfamily)